MSPLPDRERRLFLAPFSRLRERRGTLARMKSRPRIARGAAVAAIVLAIGVLGLFMRLQEYGPESAVRRFHQAISRGALPDLQRVTVEDVRSPLVRGFVRDVAGLMAQGVNRPPRILRTDRTPNQVRAAVAYPLPGGQPFYMVWVVERQGRTWKVSVENTRRVIQDALAL